MKPLYTVVEVTFDHGVIVHRAEDNDDPFETESLQEAIDKAAELNLRQTPSQHYIVCSILPHA